MAVEHAMFKFGDLKVTSRHDRMTTNVHSSRHPRSSAARPIMVALMAVSSTAATSSADK